MALGFCYPNDTIGVARDQTSIGSFAVCASPSILPWCAGGDKVALTIKLDHLSEQGSIINHFLNLGLFKIEVGARTSSEVDHAFVCEAPS